MKRSLLAIGLILLPAIAHAQTEPDYSTWTRLLKTYYDPAHGMDYAHLKARDAQALEALKQSLGRVNAGALTRKQQLAYWINVYNVNSVATIVESYPVKSIRDISTDPIIRLNVFKKDRIPLPAGGPVSLDFVENEKLRNGFHDPRIHFAINCAAKSCPPLRTEAYVGERVDAQLDDQVRRFLAGPLGLKLEKKGEGAVAHVTKIVDWFGNDFDTWGGGKVVFLRRYVTPEQQKAIDAARGEIRFDYDDYDWELNDWKR